MNIFKKKIIPQYPGFTWLAQDIHSHLLPGIDDGSPDTDTSIFLIKQLMDAGIQRFICTPHIIGDMYRNTPETVGNALEILKKACLQHELQVELHAAAEYMLDDYFMELLRKEAPLLTLTKNYLLTELSYSAIPDNLDQISFEILTHNYQPLMAHPERYHYYHKNYPAYTRLKELGFQLQVNLLSLTGYYGKNAAKAAKFLIEEGLVDFVGTDLHHINHLKVLTDKKSIRIFEKYLGNKVYNQF